MHFSNSFTSANVHFVLFRSPQVSGMNSIWLE